MGLDFADTLTPMDKAPLGLQAELSVWEIAELTALPVAQRAKLREVILANIREGTLPAYGEPEGWTPTSRTSWRYGETQYENPFPKTDAHQSSPRRIHAGTATAGEWTFANFVKAWNGDACLVNYADYSAFLKNQPECLRMVDWKDPAPPPAAKSQELQPAPTLVSAAAKTLRNVPSPGQVAKDKAYRKAVAEALALWESGDKRKHHLMVRFLFDKYKDDDLSKDALKDKLKEALKKINRPDLIFNHKTG